MHKECFLYIFLIDQRESNFKDFSHPFLTRVHLATSLSVEWIWSHPENCACSAHAYTFARFVECNLVPRPSAVLRACTTKSKSKSSCMRVRQQRVWVRDCVECRVKFLLRKDCRVALFVSSLLFLDVPCEVYTEPQGCYTENPSRRALRMILINQLDPSKPGFDGHIFDFRNWDEEYSRLLCKCARAARNRGFSVFGVNDQGKERQTKTETETGTQANTDRHRKRQRQTVK